MMLSLLGIFLLRLTWTINNFNTERSGANNDWQGKTTTRSSSTQEEKPVQVFILAGQSNMVGFGSVYHLKFLVQDAGKWPHLMKKDQWVVRPQVRVVLPARNDSQALTVGLGFNQSYIGPELGFGWTISEHFPDDGILLIKAAWDGYSLAVQFRPPLAGIGNYTNFRHHPIEPDKYGAAYREMMTMVNGSITALSSSAYEFKGFVWFQGWGDQNPQKNAEYESNLVHLIQNIRSDLQAPDLKVVVGQCGQYRGKHKDQELLQRVRDAQQAAVLQVNNSQLVDARLYTHENRTEQYNAGFHYHGHADTYYEVGVAFGNAMLELLGV